MKAFRHFVVHHRTTAYAQKGLLAVTVENAPLKTRPPNHARSLTSPARFSTCTYNPAYRLTDNASTTRVTLNPATPASGHNFPVIRSRPPALGTDKNTDGAGRNASDSSPAIISRAAQTGEERRRVFEDGRAGPLTRHRLRSVITVCPWA